MEQSADLSHDARSFAKVLGECVAIIREGGEDAEFWSGCRFGRAMARTVSLTGVEWERADLLLSAVAGARGLLRAYAGPALVASKRARAA